MDADASESVALLAVPRRPSIDEEHIAYPDSRNSEIDDSSSDQSDSGPTPWRQVFFAAFNFINATIGAGILGLPKMVASAGIVVGPLVIVLMGLLSNYSLRLLHQVALLSGQHTYEAVARDLYGRYLANAVSVAIVFINFGACIAYTIVVCDFLKPIMQEIFGTDSIFANREILTALVTILCFLPLSLLRNISSLEMTSAVSIFLTLGFVGIVVVRCFVPDFQDQSLSMAPQSVQFFQGLGVVLFAFDCSSNLIPITTELGKDNTRSNGAKVITITTTVSSVAYVIVGIFGFMTFGPDTDGNILNNYPSTDVLINVMRAIMAVNIICTFPLAMFPCRVSIDEVVMAHPLSAQLCFNSKIVPESDFEGQDTSPLLHGSPRLSSHDSANTDAVEEDLHFDATPTPDDYIMIGYVPVTKWRLRFVLQVAILMSLSYMFAVLLPKVDYVFSIVGSTASACLTYIFPSLIWLRARLLLDPRSADFRRNVLICPILVGLGIIFGVFGTVMSIVDLAT